MCCRSHSACVRASKTGFQLHLACQLQLVMLLIGTCSGSRGSSAHSAYTPLPFLCFLHFRSMLLKWLVSRKQISVSEIEKEWAFYPARQPDCSWTLLFYSGLCCSQIKCVFSKAWFCFMFNKEPNILRCFLCGVHVLLGTIKNILLPTINMILAYVRT